MNVLHALAWIIGACNPVSALLVGPALADFLARHGRAHWVTWAQGTGWLVLAAAQVSFLGFGWISGYGGFKWAQALMIPAALLNFAAWWAGRRRRDPVTAMFYAIRLAEATGRITATPLPDQPDIPVTVGKARTPMTARSMRIVPLDPDTGEPDYERARDITGPVSIGPLDLDEGEAPSPGTITIAKPGVHELSAEFAPTGRHHMTEKTRDRIAREFEVPPESLDGTWAATWAAGAPLDRTNDVPTTCTRLVDGAPCQRLPGHDDDCSPSRVQCSLPVYGGFPQPPERCALDEGHEGLCET